MAIINVPCASCGFPIYMTQETNDFLRSSEQGFTCLSGHSNVYSKGESREDILRRERDRLKQQIAQKDDEVRAARDAEWKAREEADHQKRRANGYKGHATRITKRAKAGICPCCNRHFTALERHMATKHPEFTPDCPEPLRVIEGGKS